MPRRAKRSEIGVAFKGRKRISQLLYPAIVTPLKPLLPVTVFIESSSSLPQSIVYLILTKCTTPWHHSASISVFQREVAWDDARSYLARRLPLFCFP